MSRRIIQDVISRVIEASRRDGDSHEEAPRSHQGKRRRIWVSILLVVISSAFVLGLFLLVSSSFSHVSIKVITTKKDIDLDELIFLNKDGGGGGVKYNLMRFEGTESSKVPITGSKIVSKAATGSVTIYNSYSPATQKLVVGTRLETKDGKIYKIVKPVIVPGTRVSSGKTLPGTIDVSVVASLPGDKFNIPPTEFTIPGLKGSPKYQKIYAKSDKDILGGFSGEIKTLTATDLQKARSELQESIKRKLTKDALTQVPKGFLFYEDALLLNFKDNAMDSSSLIETAKETSSLKVTGVLSAIIIDENDLKKLIINKKITDPSSDTKILVFGLDKIILKVLNKDKIDPSGNGSVLVKITGKLSLVWDFDDDVLKNRLIGIKKSKFQEVFKDFPVIEKAETIFSPSWALYFPSDIKRIGIDKNFGLKQ